MDEVQVKNVPKLELKELKHKGECHDKAYKHCIQHDEAQDRVSGGNPDRVPNRLKCRGEV